MDLVHALASWKEGLLLTLGVAGIVCTLLLKLGTWLDALLLRRHKLALYRSYQQAWIRLDDTTVPNLPQLMAGSTVQALSALVPKSFQLVSVFLISLLLSGVLTTTAVVLGEYIQYPSYAYSISGIIGLLTTLAEEAVRIPVPIGFLYGVNLLFDGATIVITVHILRTISTAKGPAIFALIVLDVVLAVLLAILCGAILSYFYHLNSGNYVYGDLFINYFGETYEDSFWAHVALTLEALPEMFKGGTGSAIAIFASTTMIPTGSYALLLVVLLMAKPIAAAGRRGTLHYLEKATEHAEEELEKFKPFALLGSLFSVLGIFAGAALALFKL